MNVTSLTNVRPERATTSLQVRHSQWMTFPIALSTSPSSPSCVSAPRIGLVPLVPHWTAVCSHFFQRPELYTWCRVCLRASQYTRLSEIFSCLVQNYHLKFNDTILLFDTYMCSTWIQNCIKTPDNFMNRIFVHNVSVTFCDLFVISATVASQIKRLMKGITMVWRCADHHPGQPNAMITAANVTGSFFKTIVGPEHVR
jgi:hypothetical protein